MSGTVTISRHNKQGREKVRRYFSVPTAYTKKLRKQNKFSTWQQEEENGWGWKTSRSRRSLGYKLAQIILSKVNKMGRIFFKSNNFQTRGRWIDSDPDRWVWTLSTGQCCQTEFSISSHTDLMAFFSITHVSMFLFLCRTSFHPLCILAISVKRTLLSAFICKLGCNTQGIRIAEAEAPLKTRSSVSFSDRRTDQINDL